MILFFRYGHKLIQITWEKENFEDYEHDEQLDQDD